MRLKKVGDWIQYVTESGPTFYYNDKNGEFQWVDPSREEAATSSESAGTSGDWKPYKDPQSGNIFWYNKVTGVSQWECPLETIPPELLLHNNQEDGDADGNASVNRSSNNNSPEKDYDYSAVEVGHEDELGI
jgi:hypothetical protein